MNYLKHRFVRGCEHQAKSREEFIEEWGFRALINPAQVAWDQDTYKGRQEALRGILTGVRDTPDQSVGLLLTALAGPVWLRDALMTTLAGNLAEYETTLKAVAQSTENPSVLAPIAFAVLMGGNELAANALADRIDDDTPLMKLVRQSLKSGQSHLISKQMITDELLEASLRTGL